MPDQYESVRSLPFPALASALGLDLQRFKRRKEDWQGYCPVHQSKTNNNCFAYHDSGKFHCFSCNAKGSGSLDLTMAVLKVGFKQAVELLSPLVGSQPAPQQKTAPSVVSDATDGELKPLLNDSWRKFAQPCPWLEARVPDARIRELYGIYMYNNPARRSAYSGRVMIPIKGVDGVLYGYLGRATDSSNEPKYLFPRDFPKSRFLFGAYELRQHLAGIKLLPSSRYKEIYLVESPFCCLRFAMYGLPAVSPFGWSVSSEQISLLCQLAKGVVYIPDRNKVEQASSMLNSMAKVLWLRFPPLPVEDPEQLDLSAIQALTR